MRSRYLLTASVAILMALISAKLLFNGLWLNIIPWGILAFATAFLAPNKKAALKLGGVFGFVVSYSFWWFDDTSRTMAAHILVLIPLIMAPALFGALCGLAMAWLGWTTRRMLTAKPMDKIHPQS